MPRTTAAPVQGGAVSQDVNSLSDLQVLLQAAEMTPTVSGRPPFRALEPFSPLSIRPGSSEPWLALAEQTSVLVRLGILGMTSGLPADQQVNYSAPLSSRRMAGGHDDS